VVVAWGCSHRAARRPHAATSPVVAAPATTTPAVFARPTLGIQLAYPAGWGAGPSTEYELLLRPARSGDASDTCISLDVPDLPFHLPGMIPIGAVRSGYLDDLRKQAPSLATEDLTPPDVGASSSRFVRSRWMTGGGGEAMEETALLMVRGDRVYILRARSDAGHSAETRAAFDGVVRSVRWIKPSAP
jgi:hypothetical protein